jgi:RND family efflux transporter MFP subunit
LARRSLLLSLFAFTTLPAACHKDAPEPEVEGPTVRVVVAALSTQTSRVSISGVLAPLPGRDVRVGALVGGRVDEVFVAEGQAVKIGQALAHIEAQPLRDRVTETGAQHALSQAMLDNARTRLSRTEKLWKDGIASHQEVDDARAQLVAADSAVKQAQAGNGTAELQLGRATLRSPIDGLVAAILVPAGQPVDGNATPVIEIADQRELDLRAPVPAARAGQIVVDQPAELSVEGAGVVVGKVVAIAPLVDTATNTVMVRVRVPNTNAKLRGGMFALGALLGAPHPGIALPRAALLPGDGGDASAVAVVLADGTVAHHTVTVRGETGDIIEVSSGVAPGDRVIIAGAYALPDGTKVVVAP